MAGRGGGTQGVAQAGERSEWAKLTNMAAIMWETLPADGLNPSFSSGKDVSNFTAMFFDLNKRMAESVVNFAGIYIVTIACKEAGRGGGIGKECRSKSGSNPSHI